MISRLETHGSHAQLDTPDSLCRSSDSTGVLEGSPAYGHDACRQMLALERKLGIEDWQGMTVLLFGCGSYEFEDPENPENRDKWRPWLMHALVCNGAIPVGVDVGPQHPEDSSLSIVRFDLTRLIYPGGHDELVALLGPMATNFSFITCDNLVSNPSPHLMSLLGKQRKSLSDFTKALATSAWQLVDKQNGHGVIFG